MAADQKPSYEYLENLTEKLIKVILPLGVSFAGEKDVNRLLERILLEAQNLCNADGGTLYLRSKDRTLRFVMIHTKSLGIAAGGTTGKPITFPPLPTLDPKTGSANMSNIATYVALSGEKVNIANIYEETKFDVSGAKSFDAKNNYKSISCLAVPLLDQNRVPIGVVQLINAVDPMTNAIIPFNNLLVQIVEALVVMASIGLQRHIDNLQGK